MKKLIALLITIVMSLTFIGCDDQIDPMEEDKQEYENILAPFAYPLGTNNFDKAEDIDPDAFVIFYFTLPLMDEITISEDYDKDKTFGNPLIPADDLERIVTKYFDFEIPKDYIKKSEYYLKDENSYYCGGIGSVVDIKCTKSEKIDNELTIWYEAYIISSDYKDSWDGSVTIILDDEGEFRYKTLTKNLHNLDGENILPSSWSEYKINTSLEDNNQTYINLMLPKSLTVDNNIISSVKENKKIADFNGIEKIDEEFDIQPFIKKEKINADLMKFIYPDPFDMNTDTQFKPYTYNQNLDLNTYYYGKIDDANYIAFIHNHYYPTIDGGEMKIIEFAVFKQDYVYKFRFYIEKDLNSLDQIETYEKIIATSKMM